MHHFKTLALRSTATLALLGAFSFTAQAQVIIENDTDEQIRTSTAAGDGTAADVTVGDENNDPTVTIDAPRSGIILDSANDLIINGNVEANDIDNVTGVELEGGADRSFTLTSTGNINLLEDFAQENTDDDPFTDTPFAEGEGRTGILISGASPFQGNIELEANSSILVEGNDSFGVNLANTPMMTDGLTGNLTTNGQIGVTGDRSIGVNLGRNVTGDVVNEGFISVRGEDSQAYVVSGDIDGGFDSSGTLAASAFRVTSRPTFLGDGSDFGREDLTAEDLLESGAVLEISGNVSEGIFLSQRFVPSLTDGVPNLDDDGEQIFLLAGVSSVTQLGSAPAVLIDGGGTPIAVGLVAQITDPDDPDFDEDLQFGFVNQGAVTAEGIFDDFDATAISVANVTFAGGINNTGGLSASTFRAPNPTDLTDGDGIARVLVLGDNAIAEQINNSGIILATANEASDEVFFDRANIIPPRSLTAVAIDIGAGASVTDLVNTGTISAVLVGRDGTAVAVRDSSGTVRTISNTGSIRATGSNSDPLGVEDTNFDLIAIDFGAATDGITITQTENTETDAIPNIQGDIFLGSGDDTIIASAGVIVGDLDFGGGNDTLTLSNGAAFGGAVTNTDSLALSVTGGSQFALGSDDDLNVSEATFDGTSVYRPFINGATGEASTLVSDGSITFEDGAFINPILNQVIGSDTSSYVLASAADLTVGDLQFLSAGETPFLFETALGLSDPNTLVVTLDLRDPTTSVADGGLGLDAVQAAAFGSTINGQFQNGPILEALQAIPTLGNAFSNITEANEFYAAFNQLLPEFSGASKQFILANVDGAVGSVGTQLDAARRSPERSGGAWLEEFFYFADRSLAGQSEQYRGEGFGFSSGIDTAFGPFHAVGVNVGFASTQIEDVLGIDSDQNIKTFQGGAYAGYQAGDFNFDVYAGGGYSEFDQDRLVNVSNFVGTSRAEWDGTHFNAALRAGYDFDISETFWARPSLSVDFLNLHENGYTETGDDGVRLRVDGRTSDTAAATVKLDFGARFQGKRTWIRPSVRVGYRNEFISDRVETDFRFQGLTDTEGNLFDSELATLRAFAFPENSILLGFTMAAGSEYSSIGFDFDSDIREGFIRHTGRIVVRLLF